MYQGPGEVFSPLRASVNLAVNSPEDFVEVAVELVRDPKSLSELRIGLRGRLANSALLDHREFTARLESAYGKM